MRECWICHVLVDGARKDKRYSNQGCVGFSYVADGERILEAGNHGGMAFRGLSNVNIAGKYGGRSWSWSRLWRNSRRGGNM